MRFVIRNVNGSAALLLPYCCSSLTLAYFKGIDVVKVPQHPFNRAVLFFEYLLATSKALGLGPHYCLSHHQAIGQLAVKYKLQDAYCKALVNDANATDLQCFNHYNSFQV